MLKCDCGEIYHPDYAEKNLVSRKCKCGRIMRKAETWIKPIGELNMLEAKRFQGKEAEYLKNRKLRDGF